MVGYLSLFTRLSIKKIIIKQKKVDTVMDSLVLQ